MPLLTEADPPRKRRALVWVIILAAVLVLPLGLFAGSCVLPIEFGNADRGLAFGRVIMPATSQRFGMHTGYSNRSGVIGVKLPGDVNTGWYLVSWAWQ